MENILPPGETMEAFAESHFHDDKIELEEVREQSREVVNIIMIMLRWRW